MLESLEEEVFFSPCIEMAEKSSMLSEKEMHQMCGLHLFYKEHHLWCEATHSMDAGKAGLSFLAGKASVLSSTITWALHSLSLSPTLIWSLCHTRCFEVARHAS